MAAQNQSTSLSLRLKVRKWFEDGFKFKEGSPDARFE
jgi:hypothetical protein